MLFYHNFINISPQILPFLPHFWPRLLLMYILYLFILLLLTCGHMLEINIYIINKQINTILLANFDNFWTSFFRFSDNPFQNIMSKMRITKVYWNIRQFYTNPHSSKVVMGGLSVYPHLLCTSPVWQPWSRGCAMLITSPTAKRAFFDSAIVTAILKRKTGIFWFKIEAAYKRYPKIW
jgi:hypothetical protein